MSSGKITETRFYNRYGNKKVALLEEGQSIEIDSVYGFDEYHFEDIGPSRQGKLLSRTARPRGTRQPCRWQLYCRAGPL